MPRPWVLVCLLCLSSVCVAAAEVTIDDFESLDAWAVHADGGRGADFSADAAVVHQGDAAMRVRYAAAPPQWCNLVRPVTVPGPATEVALWVYVRTAGPKAGMHLWFMEPDGDGWVAPVLADGERVGQWGPGWHDVRVPMGSFQFQPRGAKTRQLTRADRMLLGFNFDDMDVTIDSLRFVLRDAEGGEAMPPRTAGLVIARGSRGSAVILKDTLPTTPGAADPVRIGEALAEASWGVTYITAADLCDAAVLDPSRVDLLVLPGGPAYPAQCADALRAYLKAGGALIAIGGYALDWPMSFVEGAWRPVGVGLTAEQVTGAADEASRPLNTRMGQPGDALVLDPEQIQVFDPQFVLKGTAAIRAAEGQFVVPRGVAARLSVTGYSAVSTLGSNSAVFPAIWGRRIPLVYAEDPFGRLRGTVGAIIHNHGGPYAGSSWAVFGVDNVDLFSAADAPLHHSLPAIAEAITRPCYLRSLDAGSCYRADERPIIRGTIVSRRPAESSRLELHVEGLGSTVIRQVLDDPQPEGTYAFQWEPPSGELDRDFYTVRADLYVDGEPVDTMRTAFVVWDPEVIAGGPKVGTDGPRLTVNGRPTVLSGTNQTGFMWFSEHEDPLVWDQDFRAMRDHGVNVLRILHFSPFSEGGYDGRPTNRVQGLARRPERLCRQTDAIVQLAQKHGIVLFLSLHDWMDVGLSDEDYAAQRDWNRFWVERYRDVPGIIYDIQNEPSIGDPPDIPNLRRIYNRMLAERYRDEAGAKAAWGVDDLGGPWGDVPIRRPSDAWSDVAAHDYWRFKMDVYNAWTRENVAGVREGDADALVTVGNLNSNINADKQVGSRHLDFTNTHFYGSLEAFAQILKFLDRRWEGKPLSVGEFGAQEAHDRRTSGGDGAEDAESIRRFLWFGHYTLGMGGSFLCNWSWKDFEGCVFPWGIRYVGDPVSKDVLLAYRAQSLLFRRLQPDYRTPELFVLQPDSHRFGPQFGAIEGAMQTAFCALYHAGVPFGVLGEWDLDRLPASARALIWPVPYCPSDETFARVRAFVEAGGALYVSGDLAFDDRRQPTRGARLTELGLPEFEHVPPGEAPPAAFDREPFTSQVGQGQVFYVPYPAELRVGDRCLGLYRGFLAAAGLHPETPSDPPGQVLRIPLAGGGHADVFAHYAARGTVANVISPEFSMALPPLGCGLVAVGADGQPTAFHTPGTLAERGGDPIVSGDVHVMGWSLTGRDVFATPAVALAPLNQGRTTLDVLRNAQQARLLIGEIKDGRWRTLAERTVRRRHNGFEIEFAGHEALSLAILAAPGREDEAIKELESDVALDWAD